MNRVPEITEELYATWAGDIQCNIKECGLDGIASRIEERLLTDRPLMSEFIDRLATQSALLLMMGKSSPTIMVRSAMMAMLSMCDLALEDVTLKALVK